MLVGVVVFLGLGSTVRPAWGGTDVGNGMPVGLTRGQTARLNVLQPPSPITPPDPVAPCPVLLQFFDSQGTLLAEARETVPAGHLRFLDLEGDEVFEERDETRLQIYGLVRLARRARRHCRGLIATLELFDSVSFATLVVVTPPNPIAPRRRLEPRPLAAGRAQSTGYAG
jgi:hypothetical protein